MSALSSPSEGLDGSYWLWVELDARLYLWNDMVAGRMSKTTRRILFSLDEVTALCPQRRMDKQADSPTHPCRFMINHTRNLEPTVGRRRLVLIYGTFVDATKNPSSPWEDRDLAKC